MEKGGSFLPELDLHHTYDIPWKLRFNTSLSQGYFSLPAGSVIPTLSDTTIEHYYSYCEAIGIPQDDDSNHALIDHYHRWSTELLYTMTSPFNKALQPK